ncbi:MAG: ferredoxin--NADP reductase [Burkholderiales bacterium]|nr:ferredoxin--NADP reductase [Burkholderiales bacterium]
MGAVLESGLRRHPLPLTPPRGEKWTAERVLSIRRWTPTLLSIRLTRYRGFRFTPGHYARLGLEGEGGETVWRPFSVVSAAYDEHLEFLAVLVPGGAFSGRLDKIAVGDTVLVEKASYGFLTLDQLAPGRDLWLLASGSGIGPFLSILREPQVWQDFERLVVVHSVRRETELAYRDEILALPREELFAGARAKLHHVPVVTREPGTGALSARIPRILADGRLEAHAGAAVDREDSRVMVCGNPEMARELRGQLAALGFQTSRRNVPGQMAFENYW